MTSNALILFAHGARDPRWVAPFERLQQMTQAQMPTVDVRLAFLELMTPRLPETVAVLVDGGCTQVTVVPVFLGRGGHDHPQLQVKVVEAVGENPAVLDAMARYCISAIAD